MKIFHVFKIPEDFDFESKKVEKLVVLTRY
jgi:hypothetical protein